MAGENWRSQALKAWSKLTPPPPPGFTTQSPIFDRFCIALLAIDWTVFGSMHFSLHGATVRMLPLWVPFPDAVVDVTGVCEVVVGILMIYPRARRVAAACSLLLLILLIPAVLHILTDDTALPYADPSALPNRLWRLLGVPHNVLLAICSIHVFGKPFPDKWTTRVRTEVSSRGGATLVVAGVLLLCNAAGFLTLYFATPHHVSFAAMWMMMCLAVGGLTGFLFAVPRANTSSTTTELLLPNRNIEDISDWLTKIIVGLGLVNFKEIVGLLVERSTVLAPTMGTDPSYVLAMIVYFLVAGFLEGYLLTRMFLQWHFAGADVSRARR